MIVMCCYNWLETQPFKKSKIFKEINAFIQKIIYWIYWILFTVIKSDLNVEKYRCISINYNVVEKLIYFSNSTQIVKLVY